jgi:AraC family transcriptional regulator
MIEGLILEMLGLTSRQNSLKNFSAPPRWLKQVRELIHQRFAEKLSLGDIADAVQIHPSHLARTFRKYHHCSVGEYVRRVRVEYSAREILRSGASLAHIAFAAGFSDQSHLTREFKRQMQITPAEYKKLRPRTVLTKKR